MVKDDVWMPKCKTKESDAEAAVISIYMSNISSEVIACQRQCVLRLLPDKWIFKQYLHSPSNGSSPSHARAIEECLSQPLPPVVILLDVDCIPLSSRAFPFLFESCQSGSLVGCVQRANHIENNKHLYVGPFCMAFAISAYEALGRPSFDPTHRGDVGEELTYRWQESGRAVQFLWPTDVLFKLWDLIDGCPFGMGTTFGNLFYHSFCIRSSEVQAHFIHKCRSEIEGSG